MSPGETYASMLKRCLTSSRGPDAQGEVQRKKSRRKRMTRKTRKISKADQWQSKANAKAHDYVEWMGVILEIDS